MTLEGPAAEVRGWSRAGQHEPLSEEVSADWLARFGHWEQSFFPNLVGLELLEVRSDFAVMRLPYRPELNQPGGVVHGGAS